MRSFRRFRLTIFEKLFIFAVMAVAFTVIADIAVRPIVSAAAKDMARQRTLQLINSAVSDIIAESGSMRYIDVRYDAMGYISSVETDIEGINGLQTLAAGKINGRFAQLSDNTIKIPAGTLTGSALLSGKGFEIDFKAVQTGSASAVMASTFTDAGVNQTIHKIALTVSAEGAVIVSGRSERFEVRQEYILADTVIAGKIPESYTYVTGGGVPIAINS